MGQLFLVFFTFERGLHHNPDSRNRSRRRITNGLSGGFAYLSRGTYGARCCLVTHFITQPDSEILTVEDLVSWSWTGMDGAVDAHKNGFVDSTEYQNQLALSTTFFKGLPSLNLWQFSKNNSVRRSSR